LKQEKSAIFYPIFFETLALQGKTTLFQAERKLCILRIGKKSGILKFPKLNELQTELFKLFKLNANDMTSIEI
jgi:hypothetical protein